MRKVIIFALMYWMVGASMVYSAEFSNKEYLYLKNGTAIECDKTWIASKHAVRCKKGPNEYLYSIDQVDLNRTFGGSEKSVEEKGKDKEPMFRSKSAIATRKRYLTIGGGGGGEAEEANISFEIGSAAKHILGFGLFFIFDADEVPNDTLEYPCPHGNYSSLGIRQKGPGYGFFGKAGLELIKNKDLFVFGLGGIALEEKVKLVRSNVTGWYYEQSSSTETHGLYGGGIGYFPEDKWFRLQVEYDTWRGVVGSVGFSW